MAIQAGRLAYIRDTKKTLKPLRPAHRFRVADDRVAFLWGDPVYVISTRGSKAKISGRGHHFEVDKDDLMEEPVLCLWQIDCGQGDASFIRFPGGKTMMIDAGPGPLMANSPAQAPSFLYWMRATDQSWRDEFGFDDGPFHIDAVVCSHPDYDHYGGFLDMTAKLESRWFSFGTVYHNGLGRFDGDASALESGSGFSQLGPVRGSEPDAFLTTLIDGFDDVRKLGRKRGRRRWTLTGSYGKWLEELAALEGRGVEQLRRVHWGNGGLPGFDPGPDASVHVLGPVEETYRNKPALRFIDRTSKSGMKSPSLTRNGLSVVLRIDYGDVRLLMTGDLNFRSQAVLLEHVPAVEFNCHVAKACHHGAEDVSTTFLSAMSPIATLFSSGDNETHAHPRAKVLGMAGAFTRPVSSRKKKFLGLEEPAYVAPLIYSTELSRSIALWAPGVPERNGQRVPGTTLRGFGAGGRGGPNKKLSEWLLADSMVYGLINVRTDGKKVVIGVMKEGENAGYQVESFTV